MPSKRDDTQQKLVGIWIRVSTEDQARGESPEHHEKRARLYAEAKGWHVREVYHLEAVSGKAVTQHPEAQRMLAGIKSGHITGLIFSKLARLARNTRELLDFADYFREYNADLISLQESIDTSSPAGRLFYTLIAAMAQWEREEIADRVRASIPIRAKLGKKLGGATTFGYQWKDGRLIPDPKEAPVRKLLYELFLEHRRKKAVARLLNEQGYRTRGGAKFTDTTVERLIRDTTAKGVRRANYTATTDSKRAWKFKPQEEWVLTPVEPIVSEELWDRCNHILDDRRRRKQSIARVAVRLFTGVTLCHCGQKMYAPSNTPKYVCYRCRNKIPVVDLEAIFHEQLKGFLFSDEQVAEQLEQSDKLVLEKQALLDQLDRERESVQKEMDKAYRLYMDDEITSEGFGKRHRPLEERLKQIEDRMPEAQAELDLLKINLLSKDEILTEVRDLHSRWPSLPHEEKRNIVEAIVDRILVSKDAVDIQLNYLPDFEIDSSKATRRQGFMAATS